MTCPNGPANPTKPYRQVGTPRETGSRFAMAPRAMTLTRAAVVVGVAVAAFSFAPRIHGGRSQPPPTYRGGIILVPLDVRVLDRDGKPVADLRKEDFTVTEDGVPQPISLFERQVLIPGKPETEAPLALRAGRPTEFKPQNRRVFLIALGRRWLPVSNWNLVGAITSFLRERVLPQDYVAVSAWERATDITTDHEAVAQVVERLRDYQKTVASGPDSRQKIRELYGAFGLRMSPTTKAGLDAVFESAATVASTVPRVRSREIAGLLEQVERHATTLASFSRPPDPRYQPGGGVGQDAMAEAATFAAQGAVLNIFSAIQFLRYIEGEKHLVYFASSAGIWLPALEDDRDLARVASDARVVIHVVAPDAPMDVMSRVSESGKNIAEQTGGQGFTNQYPDKALAKIDEATRGGYLLGYYPSNPALDGKFRKVKISVRRPAWATVLYRQSYRASDVPIPVDPANVIAQDRIITAGEYQMAIPDIPVTLKASPLKRAVAVEVQVDATKIALRMDDAIRRQTGTIELAFFCSDARQRLVGQIWKKMDFKLTDETYQRIRSAGLTYSTEVVVTESPRFVKVVVYDYGADRVGSAIVRVK
jgi:VWFA-related protein